MQVFQRIAKPFRSLSARRAWIEIPLLGAFCVRALVALRKESVDRNFCKTTHMGNVTEVALRKESVDRNPSSFTDPINLSDVALRKESVDRNLVALKGCQVQAVALRKESVDRNTDRPLKTSTVQSRSPQGERG